MDEPTLNPILADADNRQFWIVLWGYPTHSPTEGQQVFNEPFYDHGFSRDVPKMRIGDVLFVHRIKVSKIMFVGELVELYREYQQQAKLKMKNGVSIGNGACV